MFDLDIPTIIARIIVLLIAFTVHELAHAVTADYLGDPTPRRMGRITLNPLKHLDPFGTIMLIIAGFGWAKPVPIVPSRLRSPRRDMGVVAAAGPAANIAMALGWALALKLMTVFGSDGEFFPRMAIAGIFVNLALAALNLVPLPPLDGGRILTSLLPVRLAVPFARLERYGLFILLGLLATGLLGVVVAPVIDIGVGVIAALFSLSD